MAVILKLNLQAFLVTTWVITPPWMPSRHSIRFPEPASGEYLYNYLLFIDISILLLSITQIVSYYFYLAPRPSAIRPIETSSIK